MTLHIMTRNNLGNANKGKYTKWLNGGEAHGFDTVAYTYGEMTSQNLWS